MPTDPGDVPKKATAAQLANRKIKAAGGRRGRVASPNPNPSSSLTQQPQQSANPFSTIDPNVVPTSFSAGGNNGFAFGQSQSFSHPTTNSGPATQSSNAQPSFFGEQNNTSSFKLFGNQTTSAPSSFDFSTSNNTQEVKNPFSNMNQQTGSSFEGFKGNVFNLPATGNQNNQNNAVSQAAPSSGLFSAGGGGMFGSSPAPASKPAFPSTTAPSAPIFGQAPGGNAFTQSGSTPNIFGATPSTTKQGAKPVEAMQISPDGPKTGIFGASAPKQSPFSPTTSSGFTFGGAGTKPATPSSTPAFSFQSSTGGATPFGASTKADQTPKAATPSTAGGILASQATPATPAPTTSLFGGLNKADETPKSTTPTTLNAGATPANVGSMFGNITKPNETPKSVTEQAGSVMTAPASTGSSLFGNLKKPDETPKASVAQSFPATATPTGSHTPFSTPGASFPSGSLFGNASKPKDTSLAPPAKEDTGSSSSSKAPSPSPFGIPSSTQPGTSLFGHITKPQENAISTSATTQTTASTSQNSLFSPSTNQTSHLGNANTPDESQLKYRNWGLFSSDDGKAAQPSVFDAKPAFGFGQPQKQITEEKAAPASPKPATQLSSTPKSVGSPFPGFPREPDSATPDVVNGAKASLDVPAGPKPTYVDASTETKWEVEVEIPDLRPEESVYPKGATEEERDKILRTWRLNALNESFQQEISKVDCTEYDIDPIVAHYVMLRKMIGHPYPLVTLYTPIPPEGNRKWTPQSPFAEQDENDKIKRAALATEPSTSPSVNGTSLSSPATTKRKAPVTVDGDEDVDNKHGKKVKTSDQNGTAKPTNDDDDNEKPEVSDTLAMFASSYVAQKTRSTSPPSNRPSSRSGSDTSSEESESEEEEQSTTPPVSPPASAVNGGRSLFDRVQRDGTGQPIRQVEPSDPDTKDVSEPGDKEKESDPVASIFGSTKFASSFNSPGSTTPQLSLSGSNSFADTRSPSPLNPSKSNSSPQPSIFAGLTSSEPVTFGTPSAAPTSSPSLFSGLKSSSPAPTPPKSTGPEQQNSASSFLSPLPMSASTSAEPSRSTTPVPSDATADDADTENHPQVDFTKGGAGEEEEDTVFEVRSRGLKMDDGSWKIQGVGILRILKHRTTKSSRVLLRADPSGKVLLNASLIPQANYSQRGNSVQFLVAAEKSKMDQWLLRVKEESMAAKLAEVMEENKNA